MTNKDENVSTSSETQNFKDKVLATGVSRRKFLTTGAFAAAAMALPRTARADSEMNWASTAIAQADSRLTQDAIDIPAGTAFQSATEWNFVDNPGATYTVEAKLATINAVNVPNVSTVLYGQRTYACGSSESCFPGNTIVVKPGGTIRLSYTNNFPEDATACTMNVPTCFNKTNMHFHGLHVSPSSIPGGASSDDVLLEIEPNPEDPETQEYCVVLPEFHAPGTHWYHTHIHGSTAIQVEEGMLGAIIVQEPDDEHNMVPLGSDQDRIWVIQEILNANNGSDPNAGNVYTTGTGGPGSENANFLVNGIYQPSITIKPKQWQRWRFINGTATPRGLMNLQLRKRTIEQPVDVPMYLIAVDGISFYGHKPQAKLNWNLAPGNRADFLIWIEEPGTYDIYSGAFTGNGGTGTGSNQILATITVFGVNGSDPKPTTIDEIPGILPPYLQPIVQEELLDNSNLRHRDLAFYAGGYLPPVDGTDNNNKPTFFTNPLTTPAPNMPDGAGKQFSVNSLLYSATSCDASATYPGNCQKITLNTAELWTLSTAKGSAHPFHIHVNPFQVVGDKIDPLGPDDSSNWIWWDVIPVEPTASTNADGSPALPPCRQVIHRFSDYPGEFVMHCHILIHEDQGMMVNVQISGDGTGPCESLSLANAYHPPGGTVVDCNYITAQLSTLTNPTPTCTTVDSNGCQNTATTLPGTATKAEEKATRKAARKATRQAERAGLKKERKAVRQNERADLKAQRKAARKALRNLRKRHGDV